MREKISWLLPIYPPPPEDGIQSLDRCPNLESNPKTFSVWDDTPANGAIQPWHTHAFLQGKHTHLASSTSPSTLHCEKQETGNIWLTLDAQSLCDSKVHTHSKSFMFKIILHCMYDRRV